ncbi:hypothetical protein Taro_012159 [Colocasia esculenta]|uniref:DYW domain-containing protein n=1 Tax=Colocasia esculenta TaxID=4460 RepID=A0A843U389_COLES|nr:hypothetical protein [Colocasia esculenta]
MYLPKTSKSSGSGTLFESTSPSAHQPSMPASAATSGLAQVLVSVLKIRRPSHRRLRKAHAIAVVSGLLGDPHVAISLLLCAATTSAADGASSSCIKSYPRVLLLSSVHHCRRHPDSVHYWNSLVRTSSAGPDAADSLRLYSAMLALSAARPDAHTFSFLLRACELASPVGGASRHVASTHAAIFRTGFVSDVVVGTNLFRAYVAAGIVADARNLFDEMTHRDLVAWNAMLACYCRVGLHGEALGLYGEMTNSGVGLDEFTAVALLSSCAHVGALDLGMGLHQFVEENRLLNLFVANALIDMYAKCGRLDAAQRVFDGMSQRDVFTWNSMIAGLGIHGRGDEAGLIFGQMLAAGFQPNAISFLGLLLGCSHQGLVEQGQSYFQMMSSQFGLRPDIKHYGCLVDMLGRAGELKKALDAIRCSPWADNPVLWRTLLSACKIHGDVQMGELAMDSLVRMGAHHAGDCSLLATVYAKMGDKEGMARMRKMVKDHGIKTTPGWSWIEVVGGVRKFVVGDTSHKDTLEIYRKLKEVVQQAALMGYNAPEERHIVSGVAGMEEDWWEREGGGYHSEKLAIAFGLARMPEGTTLRIVKNLRVCRDCHTFTKFVSKVYGREVVVRDRLRFHHFRDECLNVSEYSKFLVMYPPEIPSEIGLMHNALPFMKVKLSRSLSLLVGMGL